MIRSGCDAAAATVAVGRLDGGQMQSSGQRS